MYTKSNKQYIEDCRKIHGETYLYDKTEYVNCRNDVIVTCRKHGDFNIPSKNHLYGIGCPICKSSKGEKNISLYLEKNHIKYIRQYKFNGCKDQKTLPFDFYLPELNMCIEYDGYQHFHEMKIWGGKEKLEYTQKHDKIKTEYCFLNNIKLIRIKYDENIMYKLNENFKI